MIVLSVQKDTVCSESLCRRGFRHVGPPSGALPQGGQRRRCTVRRQPELVGHVHLCLSLRRSGNPARSPDGLRSLSSSSSLAPVTSRRFASGSDQTAGSQGRRRAAAAIPSCVRPPDGPFCRAAAQPAAVRGRNAAGIATDDREPTQPLRAPPDAVRASAVGQGLPRPEGPRSDGGSRPRGHAGASRRRGRARRRTGHVGVPLAV